MDTFHISYIIEGRSLYSAGIYYWNIVEGRTGDVETAGRSIDVQTRTHKVILKPREERLDPHSGRVPRIVEEEVMEVTVSVFLVDDTR